MTDLDNLKQQVNSIEDGLKDAAFVELGAFERNGRMLHLCLTERLRSVCRKGKVWKSKPFLTALKNAQYGFDETNTRSTGGRDGIFLLDRTFYPPNPMMAKIYDRYLDKPNSGAKEIADALGTKIDELEAVRLVSHHMRLLGLLWRDASADWLILVDYDDTK
jgi:hypothetical protein